MQSVKKCFLVLSALVLAFLALPGMPVVATGGEVTGIDVLVAEPIAGALPTESMDMVFYAEESEPVRIENIGISWEMIGEDEDTQMTTGEVFEDGKRYWFYPVNNIDVIVQEKLNEAGLAYPSEDVERFLNGDLVESGLRLEFLVGERIEAVDYIVAWPVIGEAFPTSGKMALTVGEGVRKFEIGGIEWWKMLEDGTTESAGVIAEADIAYRPIGDISNDSELQELLDSKTDIRTRFYYNGVPLSITDGIYAVEPENEGATTTEIDGEGEFWLNYVDPENGEKFWVGLNNSEGAFEDGSTFWMNVVEEGTNAYERYYAQVDKDVKEKIDGEKSVMFVAGVTKADGTEYGALGQPVELYVQIGEDWDINDTEAVFIGLEEDEELRTEFVEKVVPGDDDSRFVKLEIAHFSPYMIYQAKTAGVVVPETFDGVQETIIVAGISLLTLFGAGAVFRKTRQNYSQK